MLPRWESSPVPVLCRCVIGKRSSLTKFARQCWRRFQKFGRRFVIIVELVSSYLYCCCCCCFVKTSLLQLHFPFTFLSQFFSLRTVRTVTSVRRNVCKTRKKECLLAKVKCHFKVLDTVVPVSQYSICRINFLPSFLHSVADG